MSPIPPGNDRKAVVLEASIGARFRCRACANYGKERTWFREVLSAPLSRHPARSWIGLG